MQTLFPGTVTRLVRQVARGDNAAADNLWNFFRSRLMRRAKAVVRDTKVGSESAEDLAVQVVADYFVLLQRNKTAVGNRRQAWAQLSMATWKRGLNIRRNENAERRLKIWELPQATEATEDTAAIRQDMTIEILDEILNGVDEVHPKAKTIMAMRVEGIEVPQIAEKLEMPVRTVYRIAENCRKHVMERLNG